ncbi:hypothetical protein BZA70DRAFT_311010 [Myxozyma melibiosi]|uniref:Arrestin C-terminal-like domain-containing protein n=1 Tax=Myxozyma melibiosi TaxID=54550 RepID=A0ABR1F7S3_9ASCO
MRRFGQMQNTLASDPARQRLDFSADRRVDIKRRRSSFSSSSSSSYSSESFDARRNGAEEARVGTRYFDARPVLASNAAGAATAAAANMRRREYRLLGSGGPKSLSTEEEDPGAGKNGVSPDTLAAISEFLRAQNANATAGSDKENIDPENNSRQEDCVPLLGTAEYCSPPIASTSSSPDYSTAGRAAAASADIDFGFGASVSEIACEPERRGIRTRLPMSQPATQRRPNMSTTRSRIIQASVRPEGTASSLIFSPVADDGEEEEDREAAATPVVVAGRSTPSVQEDDLLQALDMNARVAIPSNLIGSRYSAPDNSHEQAYEYGFAARQQHTKATRIRGVAASECKGSATLACEFEGGISTSQAELPFRASRARGMNHVGAELKLGPSALGEAAYMGEEVVSGQIQLHERTWHAKIRAGRDDFEEVGRGFHVVSVDVFLVCHQRIGRAATKTLEACKFPLFSHSGEGRGLPAWLINFSLVLPPKMGPGYLCSEGYFGGSDRVEITYSLIAQVSTKLHHHHHTTSDDDDRVYKVQIGQPIKFFNAGGVNSGKNFGVKIKSTMYGHARLRAGGWISTILAGASVASLPSLSAVSSKPSSPSSARSRVRARPPPPPRESELVRIRVEDARRGGREGGVVVAGSKFAVEVYAQNGVESGVELSRVRMRVVQVVEYLNSTMQARGYERVVSEVTYKAPILKRESSELGIEVEALQPGQSGSYEGYVAIPKYLATATDSAVVRVRYEVEVSVGGSRGSNLLLFARRKWVSVRVPVTAAVRESEGEMKRENGKAAMVVKRSRAEGFRSMRGDGSVDVMKTKPSETFEEAYEKLARFAAEERRRSAGYYTAQAEEYFEGRGAEEDKCFV